MSTPTTPTTTGWQPIVTAPTDGTPVLLWSPDAFLQAYSDHPRWGAQALDYETPPAAPFVGFWNGDRWQLAHYTAYTFSPTHWAPLPRVPQ